jgi:DNA-binding beta-propeller fold protein YncE
MKPRTESTPDPSPRRIGLAVGIALTLAACGGGATPAGVSPTAAAPSGPPVNASSSGPAPVGASPSPSAAPSRSSLPALTLVWEASGPSQPDPCCQTWWPAIDPKTGNVWVANSFANEYWIFKPDGTFAGRWGKPGKGEGEFDFSAHRTQRQATGAIAFAPDGSFYVADNGNRRIQQFAADRTFVRQWGGIGADDGRFAEPFSIATDGKTVFVGDDDRGDVQMFDPDGTFVGKFSAGIFIAIATDGSVYSSGPESSRKIDRFSRTGARIATIDVGMAGGFPVGLALDRRGHLFANVQAVSNPHPPLALVEFDPDGHQVNAWATGGETAVVAPKGDAIYLANFSTDGWPKASLRKYALPQG